MKKLLILIMLCILVLGCDDMQKPMMDIVDDVVSVPVLTEQPAAEPASIEEVPPLIPSITIDNALDLAPGLYRLRPRGIARDSIERDRVIQGLYWGTVPPEESFHIDGFLGNVLGEGRYAINV